MSVERVVCSVEEEPNPPDYMVSGYDVPLPAPVLVITMSCGHSFHTIIRYEVGDYVVCRPCTGLRNRLQIIRGSKYRV